ncbi:hypothetical protein BSKO_09082 [Bryopsis sp. KO-2023]|nr:hypothetical protein BSKO_09082 [Bryopsis sp. KO-2023]
MDFDSIENVIPHIEMAHDYGYTDLNKDQGHFPRVYKTHSWYPHCPKGAGKYVFVVRDPERAGISHYNFFNGWLFDKDSVSVNDFLESVFLGRGAAKSFAERSSNWDIVASWYPHRNDPNVLWLHYEDMVKDLPACIELVSKFLGIGVGDAELLDLVVKQSSFEFMRTHWEKFDDRPLKVLFNSSWGRPPTAGIGGENAKVSKGNRAPVKFSDAVQEKFNLKWDATVKSVSGYGNYKEMREGVNKEFGRKFGMKKSEV